MWNIDERQAVQRRGGALGLPSTGSPVDHAHLVKRDSDYRALLKLADGIRDRVLAERESPEQIAGITTQMAMQIATKQALTRTSSSASPTPDGRSCRPCATP
jgi:hypothetical protein